MLYFSRWKATAILLGTLLVCLFAVPNFLPDSVVDKWPKWAQRHVVLGLDLQGGSHILLEVDSNAVRREKVENLRDDVRRALRDAKIGYTGLTARGDAVEVRVREIADVPQALTKLRELSQPLGGILGGSGQRSVDVADQGNGVIRLTVTQAAMTERIRQSVEQSIQIIERRVNELGTVEPSIQRQGVDRILVQVPGLQDPSRLKDLLGKTAKLTFRLVDMNNSAADAAQTGRVPPDDELLYEGRGGQRTPILVEKRIMVSGEDLTDAQPGFDNRTSEPIVSFRFNTTGARRFAQTTQENVGRPFAIVLDNEVISAPVIREPILGGSGQISGNFTVESANDLAILLRAGALPAPLTIVEERTVGAGLGQDSIEKGKIAAYVGSGLVVVYILATYGMLGLFANIAVAVNVAMIFGILSLLNATLTLPGIAGIVLTVGMAVDANVLIYERMREEARSGRSAINAIDAGFARALATILDANITTLIAAVVLFFLGSGPVRGFALTLIIGIFTTVFTAFTLSRLIVAFWVRMTRPAAVPI
ncbi:protein translocase subunit SecD [Rhodoplanes azumiensis]|uniref:Protein translocase subunit SecD n=1 Tax=Rhodoplanes azumiensis TaxID=1897628 RepID=A0ABW5AD02_9BRAD